MVGNDTKFFKNIYPNDRLSNFQRLALLTQAYKIMKNVTPFSPFNIIKYQVYIQYSAYIFVYIVI